jgi:hypothetical protein
MEAWRGTMVNGNGNGNGTIVGNLRSDRGIASAVLEFDFMSRWLDGSGIRMAPDGIVHARVSTNLPAVELGLNFRSMWIPLSMGKQIMIWRLVRLD